MGVDIFVGEYILFVNLVINFIILYITKKTTKTKTSFLRLFLASLIGAVYSIFALMIDFMFLFIIKICLSILIVIVAFNPAKMKHFLKLYATFFIVTFVFGGATFGLFYLTETEGILSKSLKKLSINTIVIAIALSLVLIKVVLSFIEIRNNRSRVITSIKIKLNEYEVKLPALIDTGNSLKDPISNEPVIVVEFNAVKKLLPYEISDIFLRYKENNLNIIYEVMDNELSKIKFRLIPFKSLGKENGMLIGFKPDTVIIDEGDEMISNSAIVGIYNNSLSYDGDYKALLNPSILSHQKGGDLKWKKILGFLKLS